MNRQTLRFLVIVISALLLAGCASADKRGQERRSQAESHYIMGVSFLQEQDAVRALNEFLMAAELAPNDARIQAALAQSYQLRGAYTEAERHYLRALRLAGPDPKVQNNLGSLYLDMHRWDDAITQFRAASESLVFTNQALALTGLGFAHAQKGETQQAVEAYQRALRESPRFFQAHFHLAQAYEAMGRADLAAGAYRQALAISPHSVAAHLHLGMAYMDLGERRRASESLREVLRLAPDSEHADRAAAYLKHLDLTDGR